MERAQTTMIFNIYIITDLLTLIVSTSCHLVCTVKN
jgi:hypothetical protein